MDHFWTTQAIEVAWLDTLDRHGQSVPEMLPEPTKCPCEAAQTANIP